MIDKCRIEQVLDTQILSLDFYTKGQIGDIYKVVMHSGGYLSLLGIEMLDTFGETFMESYTEVHPLSEAYEEKVPLYQIYPLLVHIALYGGTILLNLPNYLQG